MKRNTLILISLSILTLVGLVLKADPDELGEQLSGAKPLFIAAAVIVYLVTTFLKMLRWHLLLRSTGYHFRLKKTALFFLMGLSVNSVTPGGVSGEPVRVYFLRREADVPVGHGIATIFAERFMDITVLITFAVFSILFLLPLLAQDDVVQLMVPLIIVSALLVFVGYTVTHPSFLDRLVDWVLGILGKIKKGSKLEMKLEDWVLKFKSGIVELASSRKHGVLYFVLTFVIWTMSTFRIYLLLLAMDVEVSLFAVFLTSSITYIFGVILPGGTGNIAAITAVFTAVGVDPAAATAVGVLEVATSLLFSVPAGMGAMTICGIQIERGAKGDKVVQHCPDEEAEGREKEADKVGGSVEKRDEGGPEKVRKANVEGNLGRINITQESQKPGEENESHK